MKPDKERLRILRSRKPAQFVLKAGISTLTIFAAPAFAQDNNPFIPIEDRSRPDFESTPITAGRLEIIPIIAADIEYVDNLFATDLAPVSDTVLTITPGVTIRDRREDRALSLQVSTGYETYLNNQVDDRFLVNARASGRFGLGTSTRPFAGFNVSRNDTRGQGTTNFSEAAQPLKLTTYGGNLGLQQDVGDFTITGEGRYKSTEYSGDLTFDGVTFDSGLRDFESYTGRGRVAFSRDRNHSFYLEGTYNRRDYSGTAGASGLPIDLLLDRSSDGASIRAGYARRLTGVLQLDVNVGYLDQQFDNPVFENVSSLSFDANLFWNPTRLTTVQGRASRIIDETSDPLFNGLLRTEFAVAVQHQLRRNVILGSEVQLATIDIGNQASDGSEFSLSGFARYLVSPRWSLRLRGEYFERNDIFPGSQKRVLFGAQYNF